MKKQIVLAALVVSLIGSGVVGVTHTFAQSAADEKDTLIQKLADKFGVNKTEVQAVFDQHHKEREAVMKAKMDERLSQAVTEGKITAAQKTLILSKMQEMHANQETDMESMKNMTPERKNAFEKKHTQLQAWAKENNIPEDMLMFTMKFKGGHGMHENGMFHKKSNLN